MWNVPFIPTGAANDAAWCGTGVFAVFDHLFAVDEDVLHAG